MFLNGVVYAFHRVIAKRVDSIVDKSIYDIRMISGITRKPYKANGFLVGKQRFHPIVHIASGQNEIDVAQQREAP